MSDKKKPQFPVEDLRNWFRDHARDLPWRQDQDPYRVWISEIMLQQTRVDTVIPYFNRFLKEFPTIQQLATTDEDQLLKLWEGLGYYHRALNLQKTAKIIVDRFHGSFPDDTKKLESLPGIGPYTAGAIASIAFGKPAPILDGNIRRLWSRYFAIEEPIQEAETERRLWEISRSLVPEDDPGEFNQALMELGALVCKPKNPTCTDCPIQGSCLAKQKGIQDLLPVRSKKTPLPHYQVTAAIIRKDDQVLIGKRPQEGLLGGLWEFPGGKQEPGESLQGALAREITEELAGKIEVDDLLGTFHHAYTHYKVTLHAYHCRLISEDLELLYHTEITWTEPESLSEFPMGKLDRQIANHLNKSQKSGRS